MIYFMFAKYLSVVCSVHHGMTIQIFFFLFIKSFKYCVVSAEQPQTEPIAIVNGASKSPCCKPQL